MFINFLNTISISSNDIDMFLRFNTVVISCVGVWIQFINRRKNTHRPYVRILKLSFDKQNWKRFYDGIDVPEHVPHISYSDLNAEQRKYFDNCKKTKNNGRVYFDNIGKELILVFNMGTQMPTKLIEHNCNTIILENCGNDDIISLTINYIEIKMLNGNNMYLCGGESNSYTNIISKGEKIIVLIDEVIDELDVSSCRISKEKYNELVDFDILKDNSKAEMLFCFSAVKVNMLLENTYNKKFNYELTFEMKNNHLVSKMKYKNFFQRLLGKLHVQ